MNMDKIRAGAVHLWRGVRAGIVVLAAAPAVQQWAHGGKPAWFAITSACVAAAVTAESVYSASGVSQPQPVPPPPPGA